MAELCGCNDELIRPLYEASSNPVVERQKEQDQLSQEHASNQQPVNAFDEQKVASHNSTRHNSLNTPSSNSSISGNGNTANKNSEEIGENIK